MTLTVVQAAERIRVSRSTIKTLLKHGKLTDLKPRDPAKAKHFSLIDSKQLDEVARENGLRGRNARGAAAATTKQTTPVSPTGALSRIEDRLTRIEEQIAALLAVWA